VGSSLPHAANARTIRAARTMAVKREVIMS
jgi:hypothetical protein